MKAPIRVYLFFIDAFTKKGLRMRLFRMKALLRVCLSFNDSFTNKMVANETFRMKAPIRVCLSFKDSSTNKRLKMGLVRREAPLRWYLSFTGPFTNNRVEIETFFKGSSPMRLLVLHWPLHKLKDRAWDFFRREAPERVYLSCTDSTTNIKVENETF